jgi:glycosyltransferase involved in cell wall biosynthesis
MVYGPQPRRPAIVYCPHGWAFDIAAAGWKVRAVTLAEQALARFSDRVIAISQHEARQALRIGIGADRIQLAVNGLPEAPSTPPAAWDDSRLKVLFVGRFDRQKGFDVLAKAAGVLRQRIVVRAAGAAVAGSGEAVATPDNVQMLGWLDPVGVQAQLQACDVAVVPSRWEGFGFVAAEALRAGKPVIASRVGALPELVEDGFNGRLDGRRLGAPDHGPAQPRAL